MKENAKHREAFELYFQERESGKSKNDSIRTVKEEFGVAESTVWRWHRNLDWSGREAIRSREVTKKLEQRTNTSIVENKANYLSYYHKLLNKLVEQDLPIEIKNVQDLNLVIKGALLLQGEATENTKTEIEGVEIDLDYLREIHKENSTES